ncbi:MAG: STAS domain-containing protein, partial [Chitinophagaceae bacterium]|nr:STAS domain-containing protein [Rubrivivax sp.]
MFDPAEDAAQPPAAFNRSEPGLWSLSGHWTLAGLGDVPRQLDAQACDSSKVVLDGAGLAAVDSVGAWVLQRWLRRHQASAELRGWPPRSHKLMALV